MAFLLELEKQSAKITAMAELFKLHSVYRQLEAIVKEL